MRLLTFNEAGQAELYQVTDGAVPERNCFAGLAGTFYSWLDKTNVCDLWELWDACDLWDVLNDSSLELGTVRILRAALQAIKYSARRFVVIREPVLRKRAIQDLGGRNSAYQSRLFSLKELLRGDVGSPRVLNLEPAIGSLFEFEPKESCAALC